jgi:hypothetical protein
MLFLLVEQADLRSFLSLRATLPAHVAENGSLLNRIVYRYMAVR